MEVGDWVLATDPETGETGIRRVTAVWVHDDELVDLEVDGEALTTTPDLTGFYTVLSRTPWAHVWHHVEDGRTMILIPQDIHQAVRHTGGAAFIRGG